MGTTPLTLNKPTKNHPSGVTLVLLAFADVLKSAVEKRKSQQFELGDWLFEEHNKRLLFMRDLEDVRIWSDHIRDPRFKDSYRKATHSEICKHLYDTGASAPCMY